jgi:hypothetical protein
MQYLTYLAAIIAFGGILYAVYDAITHKDTHLQR